MGRVFTNGPEDLGSIPGRVIPKTLKILLDTFLLNTQQYKVCIEGKVERSRERSSSLPYTSLLVTLDYSCQLYFYFLLTIKTVSNNGRNKQIVVTVFFSSFFLSAFFSEDIIAFKSHLIKNVCSIMIR